VVLGEDRVSNGVKSMSALPAKRTLAE